MNAADFSIGDVIDQKYEIVDVLGEGGFGIVYLVYVNQDHPFYAVKTLKGEFMNQSHVRDRFRKEAQAWINLGTHPYLVRAHWVDEIANRLFIAMDVIYAPQEGGPNSLEGHLQYCPPDLSQSLQWAIQLCHGMEYANARGIRAHRDIKPANIMIDQDKNVKISDFGLAGFLGSIDPWVAGKPTKADGFHTVEGTGFGTPPYMPPEQFVDAAACDVRSDIYSFGVVLYQMASGGVLPFRAKEQPDCWNVYYHLHCDSPVPALSSPLFPVIEKCLQKKPRKRYKAFQELREDLEKIYRKIGGVLSLPPKEIMDSLDWNNRGVSLNKFGRYEEAIACFDRAIAIDPTNTVAINNKGTSFNYLGKKNEAFDCYQQALKINPLHPTAIFNSAVALAERGQFDNSVRCIGQALKIKPADRYLVSRVAGLLGSFDYTQDQIRLVCQEIVNLKLTPHDKDGLYNLGLIHLQIDDIDNALRLFLLAEALDKGDRGVWFELMNVYFKKQNAPKVLYYADKLIAENDLRSLEEAVNKKSRALFYTGQIKSALLLLHSTLESHPDWDFLWFSLSELCEQAGDIAGSLSALDRCLSILKRDPAANDRKIQNVERRVRELNKNVH